MKFYDILSTSVDLRLKEVDSFSYSIGYGTLTVATDSNIYYTNSSGTTMLNGESVYTSGSGDNSIISNDLLLQGGSASGDYSYAIGSTISNGVEYGEVLEIPTSREWYIRIENTPGARESDETILSNRDNYLTNPIYTDTQLTVDGVLVDYQGVTVSTGIFDKNVWESRIEGEQDDIIIPYGSSKYPYPKLKDITYDSVNDKTIVTFEGDLLLAKYQKAYYTNSNGGVASGKHSQISGEGNIGSGDFSIVNGAGNIGSGDFSVTNAINSINTGLLSSLNGINLINEGNYSHSFGSTVEMDNYSPEMTLNQVDYIEMEYNDVSGTPASEFGGFIDSLTINSDNTTIVVSGDYTLDSIDNTTAFTFSKSDYGTEVDVIVPGVLSITRGDQGPIYNAVSESSSINTSPADTEWISSYSSSYTTFQNALNGQIGNNIIGETLFMRIISTGQKFAFIFSEWTNGGNGGGFTYTRYEVLSGQDSLCEFSSNSTLYLENNATGNSYEINVDYKIPYNIQDNVIDISYDSNTDKTTFIVSPALPFTYYYTQYPTSTDDDKIGNVGRYSILNGNLNTNGGDYSFISGYNNFINYARYSSIFGLNNNIGGFGNANFINGEQNYASGGYSFLSGRYNTTNSSYTGILGGSNNIISTSANYSSILGGYYCEVTNGSQGSVAMGYYTKASNDYSFAGGKGVSTTRKVNANGISSFNYSARVTNSSLYDNGAQGSYSAILGGTDQRALGSYSAILGGNRNYTGSSYSGIIGGNSNNASNQYNFIAGCSNVTLSGSNSIALGITSKNYTQSNTTFVNQLNIETVGSTAPVNNLGIDTNGNIVIGADSGFTYDGVVYVSTNGNDSSAEVNNPNKPYLNIANARNAAETYSSNNGNIRMLIYVYKGEYNGTYQIQYDGDYYFESGAVIYNNNSIGVIFNIETDIEMNVYGYGEFISNRLNGAGKVIEITSPNALVNFNATLMKSIQTSGSFNTKVIDLCDGKSIINVDTVELETVAGYSSNIFVRGGEHILNINKLKTSGTGTTPGLNSICSNYSGGQPPITVTNSLNCVINVENIEHNSPPLSAGSGTIVIYSLLPSSYIIINVKKLTSNIQGFSSYNSDDQSSIIKYTCDLSNTDLESIDIQGSSNMDLRVDGNFISSTDNSINLSTNGASNSMVFDGRYKSELGKNIIYNVTDISSKVYFNGEFINEESLENLSYLSSVDNLYIKDSSFINTNGFDNIVSSNPINIEIEGSLYLSNGYDDTNINLVGLYNLNETTHVNKLNINVLGTASSVNNLGVDSNGNVVSLDADITDITFAQNSSVTIPFSTNMDVEVSTSNIFYVDLQGSATFSFSDLPSKDCTFIIEVTQGGSGNNTITFDQTGIDIKYKELSIDLNVGDITEIWGRFKSSNNTIYINSIGGFIDL